LERRMFGGLENPLHLLIILAVALVVLGPKRLPDAGRSLGSAIKGFRESMSGDSPKLDAGEETKETVATPVLATKDSAHTNTDAPANVAS
jgi:sec-independent protein translocase protein TatA